jgi:hypothetical protein
MKQAVVITDDRPKWMTAEDRFMECLNSRCRWVLSCQSRFGKECKHLGGGKIPKMRR